MALHVTRWNVRVLGCVDAPSGEHVARQVANRMRELRGRSGPDPIVFTRSATLLDIDPWDRVMNASVESVVEVVAVCSFAEEQPLEESVRSAL